MARLAGNGQKRMSVTDELLQRSSKHFISRAAGMHMLPNSPATLKHHNFAADDFLPRASSCSSFIHITLKKHNNGSFAINSFQIM
jgi:hypothetical protein